MNAADGDFLPYGRQEISDVDVDAVVAALRSPMITQGPLVTEFERAVCEFTGAAHAVAFSSGTAALHGAAMAAGWGEGDRVIVPPITFAASANCALYAGARPQFTDIDPGTWNLDVAAASELAGREPDIRGVVAVSFAGLPVDLGALDLPDRVVTVEDACHAIGGLRDGRAIGGPGGADMTCFSFHPVKSMTTGEGGMVTTESEDLARHLLRFRTHGIAPERGDGGDGPWSYDMTDLGFNYRITELQCALGISQLGRLDGWVGSRNRVAAEYRQALAGEDRIELPPEPRDGDGWRHGRHLFPIRIEGGAERRLAVFNSLRAAGIGVQVHYIPIYRFTHYRDTLGYPQDQCPEAERYYAGAISLPMFPGMKPADVERVVSELSGALG